MTVGGTILFKSFFPSLLFPSVAFWEGINEVEEEGGKEVGDPEFIADDVRV